jgi:phage gpG-like protein
MSEVLYTEERVSQLGSFATEFGGSINLYGNWVPGHSPDDAAAVLMGVAGYLGAVQVPMEEAKLIAMEDTKERFDTETDPEGEPWEPLDANYQHYKVEVEGYPDMILQRTELLKDVATSAHAWLVIGPTLVFDPFVLPKDDGFNYGQFHQTGGTGARKPRVAKGPQFVGGEARLGGVPARPFIGLSDEAVAKISAAFSLWADGAIPAGGAIGELAMGSNILGEFPVMGYHGVQPILRTPRGPRFGRVPGF